MTEITWYKRFHGTAYDPKFTVVAIEAQSDHCHALGVWDALLETTSDREEDRGSLAKIDLRVVAAGLHLAVDEVKRIWSAFISLGMIAGERVAKWAKRQGAAAAKLAKPVSAAAQRMRRYRRRKAEDHRQGAFSFTEAGVTEGVTRVTPGVTQGVTSAVEEETDRDKIPPRGVPPQGGSARARFDQSPGRRTSTAGTTAAEAMAMGPAAHQISMLLPIDGEISDEPFYRYRRPRRRSPHQTLHEAAIRVGLRAQRALDLSRGQTTQADRGWGMAPAGR